VEWQHPSEELSAVLAQAAEPFALVERRKMFGCPVLFLNGHMFAGVYGDRIILRLSEQDRAEALDVAGAEAFEPMPGRVMKEYVTFSGAPAMEVGMVQDWMRRSLEYVGAMLPKKAKPKRSRAREA
jgi:TfoX/Sxy family transcriptional regulator of competence genes